MSDYTIKAVPAYLTGTEKWIYVDDGKGNMIMDQTHKPKPCGYILGAFDNRGFMHHQVFGVGGHVTFKTPEEAMNARQSDSSPKTVLSDWPYYK